MRVLRLAVREGSRDISALLESADGQQIVTTFTTSTSGGITVANPDRDVFRSERMSAEEIRCIVAAVIAFDRAANELPGPEGTG